jgi:sec-independent protein translocase protein TatA
MFGIGTWELVVILVLALILLGPAKLPEVAKSIGKGLASLRKSAEEVKKEINLDGLSSEITDIADDPEVAELKQLVDVRGHIRRALDDLEEPDVDDEDSPPGEAAQGDEPLGGDKK